MSGQCHSHSGNSIFVGVPNIAQKKIDEAELTIDSIVASNTRADNFTMSVNSTIRIASATSATIDAFEGIMYLTDFDPVTPFAKLQFPQTTGDSLQVVNLTQFTPIEDRVAFTRFNTWLLMNDSIHVTVEGDTKVQVSGLNRKYGVTFKKTVELIGESSCLLFKSLNQEGNANVIQASKTSRVLSSPTPRSAFKPTRTATTSTAPSPFPTNPSSPLTL